MTTRTALLQLRDRLAAATGPDRELDADLFQKFGGRAWETAYRLAQEPCGCPPDMAVEGARSRAPHYTASIDAAVTLFGPEWLLISLSEIAAGGLSIAKFGTTETPCQEAIGIGGRTLVLTICLAKVEYELARTATP